MDYLFLSNTILFQGTTPEEVKAMLGCLQAEQKTYQKGEMVYRRGDTISALGLVLSGSVSIENDDIWGNKSILDTASAGQVFAEAYACVPNEPLMVSVVSSEKTEVLFLNIQKILHVCNNSCSHHNKLIQNLLAVSARKNLNLSRRIFHTSARSIRSRLLSYLSHQAMEKGCRSFDIPFNRQQLADYLSVDRSALSNELSKMQKEGLLKTERSHFVLSGALESEI